MSVSVCVFVCESVPDGGDRLQGDAELLVGPHHQHLRVCVSEKRSKKSARMRVCVREGGGRGVREGEGERGWEREGGGWIKGQMARCCSHKPRYLSYVN